MDEPASATPGRDLREEIERLEEELRQARRSLRTVDGSELDDRPRPPETDEPVVTTGSWSWSLATNEVQWSPNLYRILGYDARADIASVERFFDAVHPDDLERVHSASARSASTGATDPIAFRIRHRDDSELEVVMDGAAVRAEDGTLTGFVGTVVDLTELRRDERQARRREWILSQAQNVAQLGSWTFRAEQKELAWSDEMFRICGVSPGVRPSVELFLGLVHPDDRQEVEAIGRRVVESGRAEPHEYRIVRASDGETRHVLTAGRMFHDEEGRVAGFLGTTTDITERKQLEAEVSHAAKMEALGRLAGGVAHDFNNLLTVILCNVELLQQGSTRPEIAEIGEAAGAAARVTRQLLAFSRRDPSRSEDLDLNQTVRHAATLLRRIIGEDVELTLDLAPDLERTFVDPAQMEQVLFNLAVNARDAMPDGGELRFETVNHPSDVGGRAVVRLRVVDTGLGMEESVRARVFEPFFTTKKAAEGTGLGLATVFGVIQGAGGWIEVQSQPGEGTTFDLFLPSHPSGPQDRPADPVPEPPLRRHTVLLVEDEPQLAALLSRALFAAGHRVLTATTEHQARALWAAHHLEVTLVVSDVVMPGTGGPELVGEFRADRPELDVLFISGYPRDDLALAGPLLAKPFTARALIDRIAELGQSRRGGFSSRPP